MTITLRAANDADYDPIIPCLDAWWGGQQMASMLPHLFFTHFRPWTYLAEDQGDILGFLAAFRSQTDPDLVSCHFIGVDPAARGRGVGAALYERLFADAAAAGCRKILAVTSPQNRASIAFHQRLCFEALPGPKFAAGVAFTPNYDGPGEDRARFARAVEGISGSAASGRN